MTRWPAAFPLETLCPVSHRAIWRTPHRQPGSASEQMTSWRARSCGEHQESKTSLGVLSNGNNHTWVTRVNIILQGQ